MENKVSLFIPVYNVAGLIGEDLRKSYNALLQLHNDFEIVIVDDHSSDKSYRFQHIIQRVRQLPGKEIRYLSYDKGPSRRENLARSFYSAKYDIIAFMDADLSCDISYLLGAIEVLGRESADVVIGSRYIKGAKVKRHFTRRIMSFFYNTTIRIMFASTVSDHQCGLKVFRKDKILPILDAMGYDDKYIRGWFWDAELLIRAQKARLKIIEMPVEWHYSDTSTFDFKREIRCLKAIFKLRRQIGSVK